MTERFPQQRNRSAQRRADADQVPAVAKDAAFDDSQSDDAEFDHAVFDESFVAAAPMREPSAADRAGRRLPLPDQRTGEEPLAAQPPRWSVRPSHRLAALRPLPVALAGVCALAVTAVLIFLLG